MKKLITGILSLVVALGCFAGCDGIFPSTPSTSTSSSVQQPCDAEAAAAMLVATVKQNNSITREDYTVPNQFEFDGNTYTVEWSVTCDVEGMVAVKPGAEGELVDTIDVNENAAEDTPYVLTALVTATDGTTATESINRKVQAAPSIVPQAITEAPVEGTAYKLYLYQVTKKGESYFTGKMSGFYYATASDYTEAVDVYVEAVEGKADTFLMYFEDSTDTKQYLGLENNYSNGKWRDNVIFSATMAKPDNVFVSTYEWTWSAEHETMLATYVSKTGEDEATTESSERTLYLGTYSTYWTFSASTLDHIDDEDACVGKLVTMVDKSSVSPEDKVAAAKLAVEVTNVFNGEASVDLPSKDATYPEVSIAWSIKEGTEADNISIADNKLVISAPAKEVKVTLVATLSCDGATDTVEIEITSKPAVIAVGELKEGVAYKMYLEQVTNGTTLYIDGGVSGRYLTMTESAKAGADVYAEKADGGYKFYILVDNAKQYINVYANDEGKISVNYVAESSCVYAYDAERNCWYTNLDGTDYYLGTYNNFNTISASKTSYINAENTGVSQFPAVFITKAEAEAKDDVPTDSSEDSSSDTPVVEQPVLEENVAYKFFLNQVTNKTTLYIDGGVSGRYLTMTESSADGSDVYAEKVDGGYKFYILVDNAKQYVNIYFNADDKVSVNYTADSSCVYAYDAERNCWYTTINGTDYYLGTYSNFNTVSASKTSYINAENTGVSQFPLELIKAADVVDPTPDDSSSSDEPIVDSSSSEEGGDVATGTVIISIPDYATENSWTNGTLYESVSKDGITVTATGTPVGTYGLNTGKYYESDTTWRIYQNENPSVEIKANGDATIASVKITYLIGKTGILTLNGTNVASDEVVIVNANSIIFSVANTGSATNGQVKITAIEVVMASSDIGGDDNSSSDDPIVDSSSSEDSSSDEPVVEYRVVTIPEALAAEDGTKIEVSGTVSAINTAWSDSYGNITVTIVDAQGNSLYVYRLATKVALGDIITIKGEMATYNGRQIGAGATATITGHDNSYDYVKMTIPEALAAADNTNVIVTGTVVEIGTAYSEQYGNISVYIADDAGTRLYLYRLTGNVEVGTTIEVKGSMATYNSNRQLTGGTFVVAGGDEPEHKHDYTAVVTAPTCTVDGYTTYTCAGCGDSYTGDVVTAEGHKYFYPCDPVCSVCYEISNPNATHTVVHVEAVAPTCTAMGNVEYWYCSDCGATWLDEANTQITNMMSVKLPMADHAYFYPCDKICMVCYEETNPNATHTVVHVEAVAATCTAMGNIEYWYCEACGSAWADEALTLVTNRMSVILPMADHNYQDSFCTICDTPDPNATVAGILDNCEYVEGENRVAADVYGYNVTTSDVGFGEDARFGNRLGPTSAPKVWEGAYAQYSLNGQNVIKVTTLEAPEGKDIIQPVFIYTNKATVLTVYNTTVETSSNWNRVTYTFVLDADLLANTKYIRIVTSAYNDESIGLAAWMQSITKVQIFYTETTPETPHTHEYKEEVTAPTCTADGFTTYTCDCGDTYTGNVVTAKGHAYFYPCDKICMVCYEETNPNATHTVVHVEAVAATCTAMGNVEYWYCSDCGTAWTDEANTQITNMMSVKLPMADHEYFYACDKVCMVCYEETNPNATHTVVHVEAVAPTCTAMGNIEYWYCSDCGSAWLDAEQTMMTNQKSVIIPTNDHNYESVVTDPTCTAAGFTTYTCAACGDSYTEAGEAATGHNYVDGVCSVCEAEDPDYYFVMTIPQALEAADGKKIEVSGTVSAVNTAWSDSYGNISVTIVDADGNELYVYRLATKVALGDIITIKGEMATYNGRQIGAGATATITGHDNSYDYVVMTIPEALKAADNTNVIVTGTVVTIGTAYSSSYNNISVYIADDDGVQLYLYRLTGNVTVGQIIEVTGSMATYNGNRQLVGGTYEEAGVHTCSKYTEATCTKPAACVVCGTAKDDVLADHNYVEGVCSACGASESAPATATASFSIAASAGTLSSDKLSISWESDNFNFLGEKASSQTAIRTSDGDHFRIYQGSKFSISGKNGEMITKVVITVTGSSYTTPLVNSLTTAGATTTVDGTTVTITVPNGVESIEFTATAQFRVKAFEITYLA